MRKLFFASAAALALAISGGAAQAATVIDPAGDFLPSFIGPNDADLDVTNFSISYDGGTSTFLLGAVLAGAINPATAGFYVIGVNTGTGPIAPFGGIGHPNVRFNQVVVIQKAGTGLVTGPSGGPLAAGAVTIVGNLFTARVPLAFLPTTGFDPLHYGFNLWPRNGSGNNNQISDFAPENATISIAGIPEPAGWALMIAGFGVAGMTLRRRTRRRIVVA